MVAMLEAAPEDQREFVAGEIACMLHLAPRTGQARLCTALSLLAQPVLVAALELGRLGVGHAMAVLAEISHLNPALAAQVLDKVLGDCETEIELTGGELRARVKRAIVTVDADAAKQRHQEAKKSAGVRGRPGVDGMGQVIIDCTAVEMATALAAIKGRAAAMSFEDPDLTQGQKEVAAFLHALGCDRTSVQAVIDCPVERAVDLYAVAAPACGASTCVCRSQSPSACPITRPCWPATAPSAPTRPGRCSRRPIWFGPAWTPRPARS